jgi:hypothetical protein
MTEHLVDRTQVRSVYPYTNASLEGNFIRGNHDRNRKLAEPQLSMTEMRSNVALFLALIPKSGLANAFLNLVLAPAADFGKLTHSTLESLLDLDAMWHPFTVPPRHGLFQVGV